MSYLPPLDFGAPFSASAMINDLDTLSSGLRRSVTTRISNPESRSTARNHIEFELGSLEHTNTDLSTADPTPSRGRTLLRTPARNRTGSRPRRLSTSVKLALSEPLRSRSRITSLDLTASPEHFFEDALLEPRPRERFRSCSLSEKVHRAASFHNAEDLTRFIGHRDTCALMGIRRLHNRAIYLPNEFFNIFAKYIDFETYKALRLSCRHWSQGITRARALRLRGAIRLPAEILQRIYGFLAVMDFNAARHTCRTWMLASLEAHQLSTMLHKGGWSKGVDLDVHRLESALGRRMSGVSRNWLLSKRLATECALSHHQTKEAGAPQMEFSPLNLTAKTDFAELAQTRVLEETADPPLRFDVSACQNYLLVTKASTIFIYALIAPTGQATHEHGGFMQIFKIIQCPSRVLAVSMDTSSHRMSVAALLGDRVGMVFEMDCTHPAQESTISSTSPQRLMSSSSQQGSTRNILAYNTNGSYGLHTLPHCEDMQEAVCASNTYQNVCSAQDPPLSVAICPQRRCVAFGNATGIEVHWVDALSGQGLQRWFPLSSRSDCLYFLPNRIGIDSTHKLRIIASAAQPLQSQIAAKRYPVRTEALNKRGPWDDFTSEDQAWKLNWAFSRMSVPRSREQPPEYYNALPLSDGNCVLFVDTKTHSLVLGAGHTLDQGVPKVTRRFVMDGPSSPAWTPYVYATGSDLRWGPRILAGYVEDGEPSSVSELWLFSIPPDLFWSTNSTKVSEGEVNFEPHVHNVCGIRIARLACLSAVAVDAADGDLTLRAFTLERMGQAYTWQLASTGRMLQKSVLADGVTIPVISTGTTSEDVIIEDAQSDVNINISRNNGLRHEDIDPEIGRFAFRPHRSSLDGASDKVELDADGDVVMRDAADEPTRPTPPKPPRTPSPIPPAPLFFNNSAAQTSLAEDEDEGYASMQEQDGSREFQRSGGMWAINVPPIHGDWTQNDDWIPHYLAEKGREIEDEGLGIDVLASTEMELEVQAF